MSIGEETELDQGEFDEFKDRDYADWKRIRTAIEDENTLVNYRLSWLFTSQAFLFTAFILALNTWKDSTVTAKEAFPYLLGIIAFLGVSICLLVWRSLTHAATQIRRLDRWWYTENRNDLAKMDNCMAELDKRFHRKDKSRSELMRKKLPKHPPLQGEGQSAWDNWINSYTIPVFFIVGWALIFMLVVLDMSSDIAKMLTDYGVQGLSYGLVVVATLVLREYFAHHRK